MKDLFVYILTNERRTTLYIGVTNDLQSRVWQHRNGVGSGFTHRYNLGVLVYYEVYPEAPAAIAREKQLKGWNRAKKEALVADLNPEWRDLSIELFEAKSPVTPRDSSTAFRPPPSPARNSAQNDGIGRSGAC